MEIPNEDLGKWRARMLEVPPSKALREIGQVYGVSQRRLGGALAQMYDDVSSLDVGAVWVWDMAGDGRGMTDAQLNQRLARVVGRAT